MALIPVYHGTPHEFDILHKGSWVSQSIYEAALHLFLKNITDMKEDKFAGWVITFPDFDSDICYFKVDTGQVVNMMTLFPLLVMPFLRMPLREVVERMPPEHQVIFRPSMVMDLKRLIA